MWNKFRRIPPGKFTVLGETDEEAEMRDQLDIFHARDFNSAGSIHLEELLRENEEKSLLLAELRHRIKNNFQMTQSVLRLKKSSIADESAKRDFASIETLISALNGVDGELLTADASEPVELSRYLRRLTAKIRHVYASVSGRAKFHIDLQETHVQPRAATNIGLIVNEAITNSFKHAVPRGANEVCLVLNRNGDKINLTVGDNGPGFAFESCVHRGGTSLMGRLAARIPGEITVASDTTGTRYTVAWRS